jgi:hypothetical protein
MATLPKISTLGERLPLELHQGASLPPVRHTLLQADGITPVDLTGYQVRGQIRRTALDTVVVAEFIAQLAPDPTEGWYQFSLTDEQTAAIPCGPKLADPASLYEWDMEIEDPAGNVRCTFYGTVRVNAGVTRPEP